MKKQKKTAVHFFENRLLSLWTVIGVSLFVRIVALTQFYNSIFWKAIWSDSATYNQLARTMIQTGDLMGSKPFFMTPLYPYFLAAVYSLFGEELLAVRIIQIFFSVGTVVLIFLSAERLFSIKTAFISGIIAALYGPFILYSNLLLVETLKVFFGVLTLFLSLEALEKRKIQCWVYAGLALGASILCRPSEAILACAMIGWIFFLQGSIRYRLKAASILLITIILLILPVTVHNYIVSKEFIPITSNGGLNFYLGNNSNAVGIYYNVEKLDLANDPDGRVFLETKFNRNFSASEVSWYWMNEAKQYIISEPWSFLKLLGKKFLLFFHFKEISQLGYNYRFIVDRAISILEIMPTFVLILPFSMVGLVAIRWKERRNILLSLFLFSQIAGVVLFFVTDRFRLSAVPYLIIFAGFGVQWFIENWKQKNVKNIVLSLFIISFSVSVATWMNFEIKDDFSTEHEYVGMMYFDAKLYDKAFEEYGQSLQYQETFHIHNNIGNTYAALGNLPAALNEYCRGNEMNPHQAISTFSIGTAYVRAQQWDSAIVYFEKTKMINPRFGPAYLNAGLTYYYIGNYPFALENLEKYLTLEPDRQKLTTLQRDIENLKQLVKKR